MLRRFSCVASFTLFTILMFAAPRAATAASGEATAPPFDASQLLSVQPPPAEGFAIRAGRMFDPKTGTNLSNQVILIKADRIVDVGPADKVQIPQGAEIIDLSNATVLPGLIDRHVHPVSGSAAERMRGQRSWE